MKKEASSSSPEAGDTEEQEEQEDEDEASLESNSTGHPSEPDDNSEEGEEGDKTVVEESPNETGSYQTANEGEHSQTSHSNRTETEKSLARLSEEED